MTKVSELTGAALDWAVAKCEGMDTAMLNDFDDGAWLYGQRKYSTDWAQGGPIIEREKICFGISTVEGWKAARWDLDFGNESIRFGPTPLSAAMRCYVASKLGDAVEIPEELSAPVRQL